MLNLTDGNLKVLKKKGKVEALACWFGTDGIGVVEMYIMLNVSCELVQVIPSLLSLFTQPLFV